MNILKELFYLVQNWKFVIFCGSPLLIVNWILVFFNNRSRHLNPIFSIACFTMSITYFSYIYIWLYAYLCIPRKIIDINFTKISILRILSKFHLKLMQLFSELFPKKKNGINIYFKLLSTIIHPYLKFAHLSPQIGSSYSETTRINIRFTRFLIVCYRFLVKYYMFLIHVILLKVFICLQHRTINIL